jgi:hypothetical protein
MSKPEVGRMCRRDHRAMLEGMAATQSPARLRTVQTRARFAIRKSLIAMTEEEREMERAMKAFEEDADQTKRLIRAEWRREHWGHDPERPPAWERA